MAQRFNYQNFKTDTLASQMAAGATSGTLSTGNFANFTADYVVLDYDVPSKREIIKCNVTGTAISSATRGIDGTSDVVHAAGAKVGYMWLPVHADYISTGVEEGWLDAGETWTYATASTFTIASVDLTAKYTAGTKIRLKQGGGYKYYNVASSTFGANTTVTVDVSTDYVIANAAITDNAYSYALNPQGFPHWFAYTPTWTNFTVSGSTVAAKFCRIGKLIEFKIKLTLAGGNVPSGSVSVSLPVTAITHGTTPFFNIGQGSANDGGAIVYPLSPCLSDTTTIAVFGYSAAAIFEFVTSTTPFVWANTDILMLSGRYETP